MAEVEAVTGEDRKLVALMTATMMAVEGRGIENRADARCTRGGILPATLAPGRGMLQGL